MEREQLKRIQNELKTLALIYTYLPDELTTNNWQELLLLPTLKERFEFIKFLTHTNVRNKADLRNKKLRNEKRIELGSVNMEKEDEQKLLLSNLRIFGKFYFVIRVLIRLRGS